MRCFEDLENPSLSMQDMTQETLFGYGLYVYFDLGFFFSSPHQLGFTGGAGVGSAVLALIRSCAASR